MMLLNRCTAIMTLVLLLPANLSAEVKLAPQLREGTTQKIKETVKTRQTLKILGQNINTSSDTTIHRQTKVGQRNAQGELPLEITYIDIAADIMLPGNKKVVYNSATGESKADDPNFQVVLDTLQTLKGATITVTLDRENQVKSVTGVKPELGASIDDIKLSTQQAFSRFPTEPVKAGDTWERIDVLPLGQGQQFVLTRKYTYEGPELRSTVADTRRLEKIVATTQDIQYSIKPGAGLPGTVTKSALKMNSGEAVHYFDAQKGYVVESVEKMHVTGAFTLNIMGQDLNGDLDLNLDTKTEITE